MDVQTFLANLGTISEAPGGIERVRDLVLDLAVAGRLVTQDASEQPVLRALTQARISRGPFIKTKVPGGRRVPRTPDKSETGFAVPAGWEWARLDDLAEYVSGLAFSQSTWSDEGLPIIRIQNLTNLLAEFNFASGEFPHDHLVSNGDILVSWSATLEAFLWDRGPGVLNQHIFKVIPNEALVDGKFLFHLLRHSIRHLAGSEAAHGLAMKHINRGPFITFPVALPPLAEQTRIVAKVDELMALCDDLEARQRAREVVATRARAAALNSLRQAQATDDFAAAWARIRTNWAIMAESPEAISELRQTVRDLAVRGRLVTGRSAGTRQTESSAAPSGAKEMPLEASVATWNPCRLGNVIELISGQHLKPESYNTNGEGLPYLTGPADFSSDGPIATRWTTERKAVALQGDLLLTVKGAGIGKTNILKFEEAAISRQLMAVRAVGLHRDFLALVLESIREDLRAAQVGIAIPGIGRADVEDIELLLPPESEQERIVATVDELMRTCDDLELALLERSDVTRRLATAATRAEAF